MAFTIADDMPYFQPIGGQSRRGSGAAKGGPAIYSFKSESAHAAIDAAGFFNAIRNMLSIGDLIYVVVVTNRGASNEALSTAGFHVVKDKSASAVDVTDVTVLTVTDSD